MSALADTLRLRADYRLTEVVDTTTLPWVDSPVAGVQRKLIERDGGEAARATSIVRYAPGARFAAHNHPLGEEILVLDGVFEDELGSYPAGTYLKNPPGSQHAPFTEQGCTLLVKLRHLQPDDSARVVVDTAQMPWLPGLVPGLSVKPLSDYGGEHAALVRWAPGTVFTPHRHWGGEEIFVLDGVFEDEHGRYPAGTWMRSPHLSQHAPFSHSGCTIFVKVGHVPAQE
ncbi:MAG: cupin domain-containing protein [Thiomonas sp.]